MNKDQIIEAIEKMTVLELAELVKALEEKFGVSLVRARSTLSKRFAKSPAWA